MVRQFSFAVIILVLLVGCNYSRLKDASMDQDNSRFSLPADQRADLSYSYVSQKVLGPKCISCHGASGGVSLENYQSVLQHLASIKKVVFQAQTMPKNGSLNQQEMSILWTWIDMGAPELAPGGNTGPAPLPLAPNFASIDQNIFQNKCVTCHSQSGTGKRILLNKEDLFNSPLELVLPGNADESGLVIAIERVDNKRMPPASEGYGALKEEEKRAIREWIQNGAQD